MRYEELITFFNDRVSALERAARTLGRFENPPQSRKVGFTTESELRQAGKAKREKFTECVSSNPGFSSGGSPGTGSSPGYSQAPCACCKKSGHGLPRCPDFLKLSPMQRYSIVRNSGLCYNCISGRHRTPECKSKFTCRVCSRSTHHSLLHREEQTAAVATEGSPPGIGSGACQLTESVKQPPSGELATECEKTSAKDSSASKPTECVGYTGRGSVVFLCTVRIPLVNSQGALTSVRAMLDTGSQCNVITEEVAHKLGWPLQDVDVSIQGVGGASAQSTTGKIDFPVLLPGGDKLKCSAFVLPSAIGRLRTARFPPNFLKQFEGYPLADPTFHTAESVDLIIGMVNFNDFILQERVQVNNLWLQHTLFGWAVTGKPFKTTGKDPSTQSAFRVAHMVVNTDSPFADSVYHDTDRYVPSLTTDNGLREFQKFWETEEPPAITAKVLKKEESRCHDHYEETTTYLSDGRVAVSLPFRPDAPNLGLSKPQAIRRFFSVEARLLREPKLQEEYIKFMREFIEMGHLELVPTESEEPKCSDCFYVPHHGVLKESSTTTKLRVVFDGSAKTSNGVSLNETLMVGPRVQDEIFKIVTRFRFHAIGMAGDVAKMYRQIALHDPDKDFHRLIWRESPDEELKIYRMTRVTYGITSSSYHAIRALQGATVHTTTTAAESALRRDFYVDDFLGGADCVEDALNLKTDLTNSLSKVCMPIRKWSSNSPEVLSQIPEADRETATVEVAKDEHGVKTLGVAWNTGRDKFVFRVPAALKTHSAILKSKPIITRRLLLSAIATVFDPLGWLSPLTVRMKILFQESWGETASWDDELSSSTIFGFRKWIEDLLKLEFLEIPRRVLDTVNYDDVNITLVLFCDASEKAMAACVYVLVMPTSRTPFFELPTSRLLAAKTKLAPKKTQTVPRLELGAMLLGARLVKAVQQSMEPLPLRNAQVAAYTDSTVALAWTQSEPARWSVFVANRVREIQDLIPPGQWRHVKTDQNPADLATRDNVSTLDNLDFWWNGPKFLTSLFEGTTVKISTETPEVLKEAKKKALVASVTVKEKERPGVLPIEKISDFGRLLRIAQILVKVFAKRKKDELDINIDEYARRNGLAALVRQEQNVHMPDVVQLLQKEQPLPLSHAFRKLNPILHGDGTVRVGGRLTHSALPDGMVRPFLLPSQSTLPKLLVKHIHLKLYHAGTGPVEVELRKQFWVIGARSLVRRAIRNCLRCARYNTRPIVPLMGDLPEARVTPSPPFTHCGLDFAGPFYSRVNKDAESVKLYLLVFVCFSTKAVHLEVTEGMAIPDTLAALKRFIARRGTPDFLYSDNGTGLMGAKRILTEFREFYKKKWGEKTFHQHVLDLGMNWQAIPPASPHMGGIWEAAVKSAKSLLKRTFGQTSLTPDQLRTAFCEIEAILNSRPLAPQSEEETELLALTPSMLVFSATVICSQ